MISIIPAASGFYTIHSDGKNRCTVHRGKPIVAWAVEFYTEGGVGCTPICYGGEDFWSLGIECPGGELDIKEEKVMFKSYEQYNDWKRFDKYENGEKKSNVSK